MAQPQGFTRGDPIPGYYWDPTTKEYYLDTAGQSRFHAMFSDFGDKMVRSTISPFAMGSPGVLRDPGQEKVDVGTLAAGYLNGKPGEKKVAPGPVPKGWEFNIPGAPTGGAAAPAGPQTLNSTGAKGLVEKLFPGAVVTSGYRDPKHNAEVGGTANSYHTRGDGRAIDFKPPPGVKLADAKQALIAAGLPVVEALDEGDHFHFAWDEKGKGGLPSAPPVSFVSPSEAMAMIRDPDKIKKFKLPDAPQAAMPEARPDLKPLDKEGVLAPFREALAPDPEDKPKTEKELNREKLQAFLQNGVMALANANPEMNMAQIAALWAAGGAQGLEGKKKEQKADKERRRKEEREAKLVLAKLGFDVDMNNHQTGNVNLDRRWQSGEDVRQTQFGNQQLDYQRNTNQVMADYGVDRDNLQAQNQTNQARAQVGLGAMQGQVQAQNQQSQQQFQLDLIAAQKAQTEAQVGAGPAMLKGIGIPTPDPKNPFHMNAMEAANYIKPADGRPADIPAATNTLAREVIQGGTLQTLLAPDKADDPALKKAKKDAVAKLQAARDDPAQALFVVNQLLQQYPQLTAKAVQLGNSMNLPVAKMFQQYGRPTK